MIFKTINFVNERLKIYSLYWFGEKTQSFIKTSSKRLLIQSCLLKCMDSAYAWL